MSWLGFVQVICGGAKDPCDVVEYRSICDISRDITGIALRKAEVNKRENSYTRAKERGHVLLVALV